MAATGHDRYIVPIEPANVEAGLNPIPQIWLRSTPSPMTDWPFLRAPPGGLPPTFLWEKGGFVPPLPREHIEHTEHRSNRRT